MKRSEQLVVAGPPCNRASPQRATTRVLHCRHRTPMSRRRLGIDFGTRRIGLAFAEEDMCVVSPLPTLEVGRNVPAAQALQEACVQIHARCEEMNVEEIVIGLPLTLGGEVGLAAKHVQSFGQRLRATTARTVVYWDERLTSSEAHRYMKASGKSEKKRRNRIDQAAAVILLQSYIDAEKNRRAR
jgi:putative Holliday junction resolvase